MRPEREALPPRRETRGRSSPRRREESSGSRRSAAQVDRKWLLAAFPPKRLCKSSRLRLAGWLAGFGTLHLHCSKESERGSGWISPLLSPSLNLEGWGGGEREFLSKPSCCQNYNRATALCSNGSCEPSYAMADFFFFLFCYPGLYDATSHKLLVPR